MRRRRKRAAPPSERWWSEINAPRGQSNPDAELFLFGARGSAETWIPNGAGLNAAAMPSLMASAFGWPTANQRSHSSFELNGAWLVWSSSKANQAPKGHHSITHTHKNRVRVVNGLWLAAVERTCSQGLDFFLFDLSRWKTTLHSKNFQAEQMQFLIGYWWTNNEPTAISSTPILWKVHISIWDGSFS